MPMISSNIDFRKVALIIGAGLILVIVTSLLIRLFRSDTQPLFINTLTAQATVFELSSIAVRDAADPETRAFAASLASTVSSDRNKLHDFYESFYHEPADIVDTTATEELQEARENLDAVYKELVHEYLLISDEYLNRLSLQVGNGELLGIIDEVRANHRHYLDQLEGSE